ncbi:MAG: DeoR/GlpR transcriptional regulator [Verrucomicrobia bacterium]|nr:DeoR/GlpR transcriptional regulator [Verrucomicrobiota bacterium]
MQAEERHKRIEEYLQRVEFASLEELARHVSASASTVRRDLTLLESCGNIRRTHGGARIINPRSDEFTFSSRDTQQLAEKEAIGRACADLVRVRESVIMDAGTTVYHAARHLESKALQIVTNSLPVANLFASVQHIEVVVTGGVIYPRLGVLVGPLAVEAFAKMHADVAVMGAGGISVDGVTNSHPLLIDIQRAMIESARRVIFCLDHTKFDRRSVAFLCELDFIDTVVTDGLAPAEQVEVLRARGLEVVVAAFEGVPGPNAAASGSALPVAG